jgi:hypothetical protein
LELHVDVLGSVSRHTSLAPGVDLTIECRSSESTGSQAAQIGNGALRDAVLST